MRMRVLPRRTVRLRLTALYGVLFLLSGAVLLGITNGVAVTRKVAVAAPAGTAQAAQSPLARAEARIQQLEKQLAAESAIAHTVASHQLLIASAIALGVMTVISAILGWVVAGRALRPVREMTAA